MVTYVFSVPSPSPSLINTLRSVLFRPTEIPGQYFFLAAGHLDYGPLVADHEKLLAALRDFVALPEIQLGKIVYATEYRPQVRIAEKFSVGRVFIAGGTQLICQDGTSTQHDPRRRPCTRSTRWTRSKHKCAGCSESVVPASAALSTKTARSSTSAGNSSWPRSTLCPRPSSTATPKSGSRSPSGWFRSHWVSTRTSSKGSQRVREPQVTRRVPEAARNQLPLECARA